jgi:hypothetical protein
MDIRSNVPAHGEECRKPVGQAGTHPTATNSTMTTTRGVGDPRPGEGREAPVAAAAGPADGPADV